MLNKNNNNSLKTNKSLLIYKTFLIQKLQNSLINWKKIYEIKKIINLLQVTKKTTNYYFDLPLNNQKTRSRQPVHHIKKWKFLVYSFTVKFLKKKQISLSKNYIRFDYINRLWYKQWYDEWKKIRFKRLSTKKLKKNKGGNINFPILQYKHIIRNFKTVNKKKQKFLIHYNLGFFFFEYIIDKDKKKKFNKNILKKKYGKFFLLKPRTQRYQNK